MRGEMRGEMRRRLYYGHPKFGQVRLPTNAATNADFLNHIGQQNMLNHLCRDKWTLESLCELQQFQFYLDKIMLCNARPTDEGTSLDHDKCCLYGRFQYFLDARMWTQCTP